MKNAPRNDWGWNDRIMTPKPRWVKANGKMEFAYTDGKTRFGWIKRTVLSKPWAVCNQKKGHGKWFETLHEAKQWLIKDLKK